jgi:outer membrane protein insertion porin family
MGKYLIVFLTLTFCSSVLMGQDKIVTEKKQKDDITLDYRNPKEFEIEEITVTGSKYLDKNALISISSLRVGDKIKIPGDAISNAIRKLWGTLITGDVSIFATKIDGKKIYLNINLTERPRLSTIVYEGVPKSTQSELNDKIKLIKGKILTDVTIKNTELAIKKFFVEKGYMNTEVKIVPKEDTIVSNGVQIVIRIDKKQKVKIERINYIGNIEFPDSKLSAKMKKTNEYLRFHVVNDLLHRICTTNGEKIKNTVLHSHPVSWKEIQDYLYRNVKLNFFATSKYLRTEYEKDKKNIITFYNSKGYRDAAIVKDSIYSVGDNRINFDITIDEGIKYYFRDIIWTGNFVYNEKALNEVLGIKKGDIYDMELVNKKLTFNPNGTDISALYMDFGYLAFSCRPVELRINGDSIDLEMRISEGKQFDISNIIIKGNDRTSDHVIRREIRTLPGQKFSRNDLIRTQRELAQLGYFDPEKIGINPIPNFQEGKVDIEYDLVEKPSDQVELSGGWGGYYGFVGTLGVVFNNFSIRNIPDFKKWRPLPVGDGQRLAVRAQANGRAFQSYSFSFSDPWFGGKKPNTFSVSLQRSVQRNSLYGTVTTNDGYFKLSGITVSLAKRVKWPDDYFTLSNSLSFFIYDLKNFTRSLGFSTGTSKSLVFNVTVARNSVDNPMFPRSGSSISLGLSLTPPYSKWNDIDYATADNATKYKWVEYHKWMFDASFFMRITGNLVANTRAHVGYIGNYGQEPGPFERFVLGGSGLAGGMESMMLGTDVIGLRGYPERSITPIDPKTGILGGIAYNKFVFELRYPVSLNPSATIYALSFLEGGNNWNDYSKINPFDLYRAAGVGARIFMPAFGLLGIDWGYGFDTLPGKIKVSGSQFHFSIGQQFR